MPHDMAHSPLVSETDGRIQFPRLVRQQSPRLESVAVTYGGLLQNFEFGHTVRAFNNPGLVLEYLTVPPQCLGRVDTRLP